MRSASWIPKGERRDSESECRAFVDRMSRRFEGGRRSRGSVNDTSPTKQKPAKVHAKAGFLHVAEKMGSSLEWRMTVPGRSAADGGDTNPGAFSEPSRRLRYMMK
jgi:hypothetical protein